MTKCSNRRPLLSALAIVIGLAAGLGTIGEAKPTDYNGLITKTVPVVELTPLNKTSPARIIATQSIKLP
ncbi:MAG: hypothetical protein JOY71_30970 [Acetobacteraceae bacterium]|nr:hypothetical protein [Acetobacteraceae bacterium]